jgi:hypothetical protein
MMLRGWVIGMVLGIWVSGGAIAAQDSQLDEVQKRRQVEAARLEAEIRDGLQQADKLKSTDPAKAIALLEALLEKLAAESVLSIAKTADYRLAIKERLQTMRTAQARAGSEAALQRAGQAELDQRLNRLKALAEKDAALRRDLAIVQDLRARGQWAEAARLAEELAQRHPENPSAAQQRQISGQAERVRDAYRLAEDKSVASNAAFNDILRSGVPPAGDVVYPPKEKWDKLTRDRKRFLEIPMTEQERKIVEALDSVIPTPTDLRDISLRKFLDDFQKELGLPVILHPGALKDLNLDYDQTFSVSLPKNVTRRSLLRTALAELGLTYVIRNETIEIMDVERAKNCMTVRVIPVDDLLVFGWALPPMLPNGQANVQGKSAVDILIDLIQDQIEPLSWQKYNGPGSITYYPPQRALIIRNSAEVINMIGGRRR